MPLFNVHVINVRSISCHTFFVWHFICQMLCNWVYIIMSKLHYYFIIVFNVARVFCLWKNGSCLARCNHDEKLRKIHVFGVNWRQILIENTAPHFRFALRWLHKSNFHNLFFFSNREKFRKNFPMNAARHIVLNVAFWAQHHIEIMPFDLLYNYSATRNSLGGCKTKAIENEMKSAQTSVNFSISPHLLLQPIMLHFARACKQNISDVFFHMI